jgi:glutamine synthetase
MIIAEYIWLDAWGNIRSKTRVMKQNTKDRQDNDITLLDFPDWNYDGSSTGQATGNASEIIIKPVNYYKNPFVNDSDTQHSNHLVLCETYLINGKPHSTNNRNKLVEILSKYNDLEPMYGFEQEFFIVTPYGKIPAFNTSEILKVQGQYYCGVGEGNVFDRQPVIETMNNCIYAGLNITGMNAEVAPSQWELQVCHTGVEAADQLIILRYILGRTLEKYKLNYDISPKPIQGDWNGSGCHTNFSTNIMREGDLKNNKTGYDIIFKCMEKLEKNHKLHMDLYGVDNNKRMTGGHETSSYDVFTFGLGNRGCSVRIPNQTLNDKKGYFEDRRPGSNVDPYVVSYLILETCCS